MCYKNDILYIRMNKMFVCYVYTDMSVRFCVIRYLKEI